MFFDPLYLVLLAVTLAITGWAAWRVKSTYAKWSKVDSGVNLDAFDFARRLLDRQGLHDVKIEPTPGQLTDHYDPRGKVLRVSTQVADASALTTAGVVTNSARLSVAAAAVIAHEVGHALQDHAGEPAMKLRQAIVPAAQFGSGIAPWLIIAGFWLNLTGLALVGLIGFAAAVLFTFATLPVEIGASGKALAFVNGLGMVGEKEKGARDVLKAAAWTYVAGALTALLTFLYYAWLIFGRRD
ncbi:MAG TPA: zinc metallopeptidase [Candidatus Limnocylindrales bacterium]|jgi:Zn-dependent membrane protease YugP|nr:zinc metallopeptidase [Candidatus Limnocylindrales bacterium]